MNIKNLKRAALIGKLLPVLEKARNTLSQPDSYIIVHDMNSGEDITVPNSLKWNLSAAINVEINQLKEEVARL